MESDIENAKTKNYFKTNSENLEFNTTQDLSLNSSSSMTNSLVENEFHNNLTMENRDPSRNSNQIKSGDNIIQSTTMQNVPYQNNTMYANPMPNMVNPPIMLPFNIQQPNYMASNNRPINIILNSQNMPLSDWKADLLCSCFTSPIVTACSYLCPCVQYGINQSNLIQGSCWCCGCTSYILYLVLCPCFHPCCIAGFREKLRASYNIGFILWRLLCSFMLSLLCSDTRSKRN